LIDLEEPREVDLMDYIRVIWRRAWFIILVSIVISLITITFNLMAEKVYETEITFRIMGRDRSSSSILSQFVPSARSALGSAIGDQDLQTYSQVLMSRRMLEEVISSLPDLVDEVQVEGGILRRIKNRLEPYNKELLDRIDKREFRKRLLLEEIQDSISIRQSGGDILSVKVRWTDPESAADIAKNLGEAFIEYDKRLRQEAADKTLTFIQNALRGDKETNLEPVEIVNMPSYPEKSIERALAEIEQKLRDFKESNKTVVLQEEATNMIAKLVDAEDSLLSTLIARQTAEARLLDIQRQLREQDQMVVSAKTVTDNPIVQYLQREMAHLEVRAESLKANFGEANPELKYLEKQIEEYNERIKQEIPRIISQETTSANPIYGFLRQQEINALIDIAVSGAKESSIRQRINDLNEKLAKLPEQEMHLTHLTRELETYSRIYQSLRQSESEARLAKESIVTNISILDEPYIPLKPSSPKVIMNTAIGAVVGLTLGFGLAFLWEYIKRANRNGKEEIKT
jgi:uncharacterized protein involved in exopolysaccharide biosynthesis